MGVLWLDGAAIEDSEFVGKFLSEGIGGLGSNAGVGVGGQLRSRSFPGADGPDRLVGNYHVGGFLGGNFIEGAETLAAQYVVGESGFAFFEDLAHANDG